MKFLSSLLYIFHTVLALVVLYFSLQLTNNLVISIIITGVLYVLLIKFFIKHENKDDNTSKNTETNPIVSNETYNQNNFSDITMNKDQALSYCRKCGAKIPSDSTYCPYCGERT